MIISHRPARLALLATRLPRKARAGMVAGVAHTDSHKLFTLADPPASPESASGGRWRAGLARAK